jgi:Domain of unknown function (DUF4271)
MRFYTKNYTFIYILLVTAFCSGSLVAQVAQPTAIVPTPAPAPAQPPAATTPAPAPAQPKFTVPPIIHPADPIVRKKPKPKVVAPVVINGVVQTPPAAGKPAAVVAPARMPQMPVFRNPFDKTPAKTPPPAPSNVAAATPAVPASTNSAAVSPVALDTTKKVAAAPIDTTYKGDPNNPFEIPQNAVKTTTTTTIVAGRAITHSNDNIINTPREPYISPFKRIFNKMDNNPSHFVLFAVLFCLVIFLSFVMTVYQQQVSKIWGAFGNEQALLSLYREQGGRMNIHFWVIYTLFVVSTGVFGYQAARYFGAPMGGAFIGLLLCMAAVALAALFRHALLKIIASIFPFYKEINQYAFTISIFHQAMGLILVPFVIFVAFAPAALQGIGLYCGLGLIALIYIYRAVRGLIIGSKYVFESRFHFLLYLCTVEIAPMVIILKMANV